MSVDIWLPVMSVGFFENYKKMSFKSFKKKQKF
jgi:hypothetical protein